LYNYMRCGLENSCCHNPYRNGLDFVWLTAG
jgi:hypothetical protein